MAPLERRRLFPYPDPYLCATTCSPACAFYGLCPALVPLSPPPPPPPPPPSSLPAAAETPIHLLKQPSRIQLPLLILASSLAAVSILILAVVLAFFIRRRLRRQLINGLLAPTDDDDAFPGGSGGGGGGDEVHHVWYIRTVGLDERAISAITAFAYKSPGAAVGGNPSCAVCLAEFHDGEQLRLLPKCGHAFHVPCIDTWLRARVSCPLCRAPVVAPAAEPPPPPPPPPLSLPHSPASPSPDTNCNASSPSSSSSRISHSSGSLSDEDFNSLRLVRRSASTGSQPLSALLLREAVQEQLVTAAQVDKDADASTGSGTNSDSAPISAATATASDQGNASKELFLPKVSRDLEAFNVDQTRSCGGGGARLLLSSYGRVQSSVLPM